MQTIYFSNSGCSAEEEDFIRLARELDLKPIKNPFKADCIVQHFCGMSSDCFKDIPKYMFIFEKQKEERPNVKIFVGGCAASVVDLKKRYPFIDGVFSRRHMVEDICKYFDIQPKCDETVSNHNVVRIQSGCLRNCGFCKKHYMDMPLQSKPIEQVLKDVEDAVKHGHRNIVLFAENSTEYGLDIGCKLIDLLKEVEKNTKVRTIDLTALCIDELVRNPELVDYVSNSSKIISVQVEIQSLIPEVRKAMNLTSSKEEVLKVLKKLSNKHIDTNIMLGYPGETRKNFEEQLRVIKEENLYYVQINTYDNTPETPSFSMPQVSKNEVQRRLVQLTNLIEELRKEKANVLINSSKLFGCNGIAIGKNMVSLKGETVYVKVNTDKELYEGVNVMVKIIGIEELFSGRYQTLVLRGECI